MKYIIGNTLKEYIIEGLVIPKRDYPAGSNKERVLRVEDSVYDKLASHYLFKELKERGVVVVLDKEPVGTGDPVKMQKEIAKLREELEESRKKLREASTKAANTEEKKPGKEGGK